MMGSPTYVTAGVLKEGTIIHNIIELEIQNGRPVVKKSYSIVKGEREKKKAAKKAKVAKKTEKAKADVQSQLDKFQKIESDEVGF
jgi:CRISPR/Cas system-associated exonuclease Cas4 (RecB family)